MESIELLPTTNPSIDNDKKVDHIIGHYENKFRIFDRTPEQIRGKLEMFLRAVLNTTLNDHFRHDFPSFLMIITAFFGERYAYCVASNIKNKQWGDPNTPIELTDKDLLAECNYPLHTLMVMIYAAQMMRKELIKHGGHDMKIEKYEKLKERLEELACNLINELYHKYPNNAKQALQIDYRTDPYIRFPNKKRDDNAYHKYLRRKFDKSKEIMAIAYQAKAMKFLSHPCCIKLMNLRYIQPETIDKNDKKNNFTYQKSAKKQCISSLAKFFIHSSFRGIYISFFAWLLCKYPTYKLQKITFLNLISWIYVLAVLLSQWSNTVVKVIDMRFYQKYCNPRYSQTLLSVMRTFFKKNPVTFVRFIGITILIVLDSIRFLSFLADFNVDNGEHLWKNGTSLIPITTEIIYCLLFALTTISSLRLFNFDIGFFIHLLKKMRKTVFMFISIFCIFWMVLAVIHVSLSRTYLSSNDTLIYTVAKEGKFEIFGEVRDEDRNGAMDECAHYTRTVVDFWDMDYKEASCLFRVTIIPFIVFFYIFMTGILLVNLLTAQLTKEYEKESENSKYYKGYMRYEQLAKIESKLIIPPPLTLFYIILRIVCIPISCTPWEYPFTHIIEKIEGNQWGCVHEKPLGNNSDDTKKAMQTAILGFLEKRPDAIWDTLNEMVHDAAIKDETVDSLKQLKNDMNIKIDKRAEQLNERARTATRLRHPDSICSKLIEVVEGMAYKEESDEFLLKLQIMLTETIGKHVSSRTNTSTVSPLTLKPKLPSREGSPAPGPTATSSYAPQSIPSQFRYIDSVDTELDAPLSIAESLDGISDLSTIDN